MELNFGYQLPLDDSMPKLQAAGFFWQSADRHGIKRDSSEPSRATCAERAVMQRVQERRTSPAKEPLEPVKPTRGAERRAYTSSGSTRRQNASQRAAKGMKGPDVIHVRARRLPSRYTVS
jgi:hypothetical protein